MPPITPLMAPLQRRGELAGDSRSLQALQTRAAADPRAAAKDAARQFESLFMGELLKSMRASTEATGMLDNAGTRLGTDMLDQQLAGQVSGRRGGLADAILRQIERQLGAAPASPGEDAASADAAPAGATPGAAPTGARDAAAALPPAWLLRGDDAVAALPAPSPPPPPTRAPLPGAAGFVQRHTDAARRAEADTGIPASFLLSQAALETGWGGKEIRHADGTNSHNLFGIKAGANWKGPVAEVATTEYVGGRPVRTVAKFRAYASFAESFADYGRLMQDSPRYQRVIGGLERTRGAAVAVADRGAVFAQNLQRAGYATDPAYADKLTRVINTTLRLQRSLA